MGCSQERYAHTLQVTYLNGDIDTTVVFGGCEYVYLSKGDLHVCYSGIPQVSGVRKFKYLKTRKTQ